MKNISYYLRYFKIDSIIFLGSDSMVQTRIPLQKRSIEKKEKIVRMGFELMCNQGYYNTNTLEIAKYAGVSTGIVYQYFTDKKDIFIEGVKQYSQKIMFPIFTLITEQEKLPEDLKGFFKKIIQLNKKQHTSSKRAHQEITAMQHLDSDVEAIFKESELNFSNKLYMLLKNNGFEQDDLKERTHLIVNLIDSFAHEESYHKHESFDYNRMEDIVADTIIYILKRS